MKFKSAILTVITCLVLLLIVSCSSSNDTKVDAENDSEQNEKTEENNLDDNINASGLPIVKEPIEIDFFVALNPGVPGNFNEITSMKEFTELSNININWEEAAHESMEEKRNLALGSGQLPDAFFGSDLPTSDIFKHAKQGTFIELDDLIEEHAPNLKSILDEYPDIKSAITYPDGHIYSLPYLRDPEFISPQAFPLMYYDTNMLEAVGMDAPETTEEFQEYLKASKEEDPDIIPFGSTNISTLVGWLSGSFGIGNNRGANIDKDPETGELRFIPTSEAYKEMLEYINELYEDDLLDERIFNMEWNRYLTDAGEGMYASTVFYDPATVIGKDAGEFLESAIPLEGPHGDQQLTLTTYIFRTGAFVMTKENEHPIETMKWVDYFYGDEGAKLRFMGVEGVSYEETDDGYELSEEITNNPEGLQTEEALRKHAHYLTPTADPGIQKQEYFKGSETAPNALEAVEKIEPYLNPENGWPEFTFTEEENNRLPSLETDIVKYVNEMQAQFITGEVPFSEWDDYVSKLEKMNLEEFMDIQEAALERFEEGQ